MSGKLIILSAPSGAGKTTMVSHLLECGLNLAFSVSATTRRPRGNEKEGKDYFFMPVDEFRRRTEAGEFVEWEEVYKDIFYGTLKSELDRIWSEGRHVLFDVDVKGGITLKKLFGDKALSLFIMPPSVNELEKRLNKRGTDPPEKIRMRVGKAAEEITLADQFDLIIVNDDLDRARSEALRTIKDFLHKQ